MVRDLAPGSKHLTVTFGGLGGGLGVWQAQIGRSEAARRHSSVHLRDHARAWYHRGVAGEGHDVDSVAGRLRDLAAGMERVVILGSSAGGYAALLFGALTGAEVHAFFAQTFIDPELRAAHGDTRWARRIDELGDDLDHRYVDLRPVLAGGEGRFHLYYATQDPLQALHAERLGELDHVTLHRIDDDWDDLVASGRLASFLGALPDAGGGSQPPALR